MLKKYFSLFITLLFATTTFAASAYVLNYPGVGQNVNGLDFLTLCANGNCISTTTGQEVMMNQSSTSSSPLGDAVLYPNTYFPINSVQQNVAPLSNVTDFSNNIEMIVALMQQFLDQQLQFLSGLFLLNPGLNPQPNPIQQPTPQPTEPNPQPTQPVLENPNPGVPNNGDNGDGDELY